MLNVTSVLVNFYICHYCFLCCNLPGKMNRNYGSVMFSARYQTWFNPPFFLNVCIKSGLFQWFRIFRFPPDITICYTDLPFDYCLDFISSFFFVFFYCSSLLFKIKNMYNTRCVTSIRCVSYPFASLAFRTRESNVSA